MVGRVGFGKQQHSTRICCLKILQLPVKERGLQGRIQDFPLGGGAPTLVGGGANLRHRCFSVKTYVKTKEFGPIGGGGGVRRKLLYVDPPLDWKDSEHSAVRCLKICVAGYNVLNIIFSNISIRLISLNMENIRRCKYKRLRTKSSKILVELLLF